MRCLEIARIGKAVRADRPQVREPKERAVVLAQVAAGGALEQFDTKPHAARDHDDLLRFHVDDAQFGRKTQASLLRDNQELPVGAIEKALHRAVRGIKMNRATALRTRIAVPRKGDPPRDKIGRLRGNRQRIPAQLIGWRLDGAELRIDTAIVNALERSVQRGRPDPIEPRATVVAAWCGERGA